MAKRKILRIKRTTLDAIGTVDPKPDNDNGTGEQPDSDESTASIDNNGNGIEADSIEHFDPGTIIAGSDTDTGSGDTPGKRKRGRPAGSTNSKGKKSNSTQNLEGLLYGLHGMLAAISHTPELELSKEESETLSSAIQGINDLYDVPVVPPWVTAWGNLAFAVGGIYGPR